MSFKAYDALRVFTVTARKMSFTDAARTLSLTKGAISYQVKRLEHDLGFDLFHRQPGAIKLTDKGRQLFQKSHLLFQDMEQHISQLQQSSQHSVSVGMSTYFASRWLMPRLMNFTSAHPQINLSIQPITEYHDQKHSRLDMAVRWGDGGWTDMQIEELFNCPAKPTAGKLIASIIRSNGLKKALAESLLLHDRVGSRAWHDWFNKAGLMYNPKQQGLVIPDPNVRVEAVINGQGIALNDSLVDDEINKGVLMEISDIRLEDYGYYLAYPINALASPATKLFHDWIITEAKSCQ